jgi:hypothetical protein
MAAIEVPSVHYFKPNIYRNYYGFAAGTAGIGVTVFEGGDKVNRWTILTFDITDAITVADTAALADGYLLYTLPAGACIITSGYLSGSVSVAEDTTNAVAEIGLGTTAGTGAAATLGAVAATAENISGPVASVICNGVNDYIASLATPIIIASGSAHTVYFNVASTWGNTAGIDLTGDIAGRAVITWKYLA